MFSNPWCSFRVDEVELPDGVRIGYGVLESGGVFAGVPVSVGGGWVLVQARLQPGRGFMLEFGGGG